MVKAVLQGGMIHPIDPLPPEWKEGQELWIEDAQDPDDSPEAVDRWYQDLETMVANNDPADIERLEAVLAESDRVAKAQVRREMGLPDA